MASWRSFIDWLSVRPAAGQAGPFLLLPETRPVDLPGPWLRGLALDMHSCDAEDGTALTPAGQVLDRFKYAGERRLVRIIGKAMARMIGGTPEYDGVQMVVHIPGARRRSGVEPSLDLAKALARELHLPCFPRFIARTRDMAPQKDITPWGEKERNVRGAFRVRRAEFTRGRKVLVVDDVYDSGATLEEAYRALKEAGVAEVVVATVTKTRYQRNA